MSQNVMRLDAVDEFLARCTTASFRSEALPEWIGLEEREYEAFAKRVSFHGLSLLLCNGFGRLDGWPEAVKEAIKREARGQTFWELSHREAVAGLIEALVQAGMEPLVMKGTALAYSLYPEPAVRRRGDTDILLAHSDRDAVRRVLKACGFAPVGDRRPLQEDWHTKGAMGFRHVVDIHWRLNASALISQALDRSGAAQESVALPALCADARAIDPARNLLLTSLNRALHHRHGYRVGREKRFDGDRLIWAVDTDRIAASFGEADWQYLVDVSHRSGTATALLSALNFARASLDATVPDFVMEQLEQLSASTRVDRYLGQLSSSRRAMLDIGASPGWSDKARILFSAMFPASELLRERYPGANSWPDAVLRARRLATGFVKLLRGRA